MRSALSRLAREYRDVVAGANVPQDRDTIFLFPERDDDLFKWTVYLHGPEGTPYDERYFCLQIDVPREYPVRAPLIKFLTPIFHPNVHFKSGEICLDILKAEWSPAWTLQSTCRAVLALLSHPQPDSPLNCDAGNLLRENDTLGFTSLARMYTIEQGIVRPDLPGYFVQN